MSLIPAGTTVTVETKYFPPLTVEMGGEAEAGPPGIAGIIVRQLKPRATVRLKGQEIASSAPHGDPEPNEWPTVRIVLAVIGGLAVFSILRLVKL